MAIFPDGRQSRIFRANREALPSEPLADLRQIFVLEIVHMGPPSQDSMVI